MIRGDERGSQASWADANYPPTLGSVKRGSLIKKTRPRALVSEAGLFRGYASLSSGRVGKVFDLKIGNPHQSICFERTKHAPDPCHGSRCFAGGTSCKSGDNGPLTSTFRTEDMIAIS